MKSFAMKMIFVTMVAATMIATMPIPGVAHHRPQSYCSESADICQSVAKVDGIRKFRIHLAAPYFHRYVLCVTSPPGFDHCRNQRIVERANGTFGDTVRWSAEGEAKGRYTVTWYRAPKRHDPPWKEGPRIGIRLGFHT